MTGTQKNLVKMFIAVSISASLYALALKMFVENGQFIPGGFSGVARMVTILLSEYFSIEMSFGTVYFLINVIPTILVYNVVGKNFAIFSVLHIVLVSAVNDILPPITMTDDILLLAIFGGIVAGFSISIALKVDASGGGTDFIAIYFANKFNRSTWNYVLAANALIIATGGFIFGWEQAMYSIIFQYCNTVTIKALHTRYKLVQLHIITKIPDEVSSAIILKCRHGITKLDGEGQYTHTPKSILYMVLNAYEVENVLRITKEVDPKVFITMSKCEKVVGNYYQKPMS